MLYFAVLRQKEKKYILLLHYEKNSNIFLLSQLYKLSNITEPSVISVIANRLVFA